MSNARNGYFESFRTSPWRPSWPLFLSSFHAPLFLLPVSVAAAFCETCSRPTSRAGAVRKPRDKANASTLHQDVCRGTHNNDVFSRRPQGEEGLTGQNGRAWAGLIQYPPRTQFQYVTLDNLAHGEHVRHIGFPPSPPGPPTTHTDTHTEDAFDSFMQVEKDG